MSFLCSIFGLVSPQVDAFYYPNKANLTVHQEVLDVGSLEQCRLVVFAMAAGQNDSNMERGDYECGVDPKDSSFGGLKVYSETVK